MNPAITALAKVVANAPLAIKRHAPTIFVVGGIVLIIGGTVKACQSSMQVKDIVTEHMDKMLKIKSDFELASEATDTSIVEYTPKQVSKDQTIARLGTAWKFTKLYMFPTLLIGGGIALILTSHKMLLGRNQALLSAYNAALVAYNAYRARVVEDYGEDVDHRFYTGMREEIISVKEIDPETGKTKTVKQTVLTPIDGRGGSIYSAEYKPGCTAWEMAMVYRMQFLGSTQSRFNTLLGTRGHVLLSEVYDALGIDRTYESTQVGWLSDKEREKCLSRGLTPPYGDGFIDFGLDKFKASRLKDPEDYSSDDYFATGVTVMHLDFNVDGPIVDMLPTHNELPKLKYNAE